MIIGFLVRLILLVGKLLSTAIVVDALLSWVPGYNETVYKIRSFLQAFTSPITSPIRRLLMPLTQRIMIDITPIIAIFAVEVIQSLLINILAVLF